MSRKHPHRADNRPASRRYVQSMARKLKRELLSAVAHHDHPVEMTEPSASVATRFLDPLTKQYVSWGDLSTKGKLWHESLWEHPANA